MGGQEHKCDKLKTKKPNSNQNKCPFLQRKFDVVKHKFNEFIKNVLSNFKFKDFCIGWVLLLGIVPIRRAK